MVSKKSSPKSKRQTKIKDGEYGAKDIYVLKGLEPVRRRPGMYIGSTDSEGLHRLIYETTGNSVTYQTPIVIRENDKIQIKEIGVFID